MPFPEFSAGGVLTVSLGGWCLWRVVKDYRRNMLVYSSCTALFLWMLLAVLIHVEGLPGWLLPTLGWLMLLSCLARAFLLIRTGHESCSPPLERS
jgi:hypothetical protein